MKNSRDSRMAALLSSKKVRRLSSTDHSLSCARRDDFEVLGIHRGPSRYGRGVVSAPQLHQLGTKRRLFGFPQRREGTRRRTVVFAEELHDVRRAERVIEAV